MQEYGMVVQTENGYENLAAEMDLVIKHLRTLLTNPSFVPLEEVEVREEEIIRLREGWERMSRRFHRKSRRLSGPVPQLSSMRRRIELWSVSVLSTKFVRAYGEITSNGSRGP